MKLKKRTLDQLTARKLGKSIDNTKDGIEDKLGGGIGN